VQRVQRSGLCYIHAPEVVQHYAVSIHTKANAGMINMAAMIRNTWSGEELTRHIFDNRGGNALVMLQDILIPGSITTAQVGYDRFGEYLQQFGPGLVTMFKVYTEFRSNNTCNSIFDGVVSGKFKITPTHRSTSNAREATQ
jgi:hypothetical protein